MNFVTDAIGLTAPEAETKPAEDEGPLTKAQVEVITKTWATVETLGAETVGVILFEHIFRLAGDAAPDLAKLPTGDVDLGKARALWVSERCIALPFAVPESAAVELVAASSVLAATCASASDARASRLSDESRAR